MESATVVMYPSPGRGHLVSMVELGKLILNHHPLVSLVILITPPPFETGPTERYIKTVSATIPSITFHHFPTIAIPPGFSSDIICLNFAIHELYNPIFHNTLVAITEKSTIKAAILDFFTNAAFEVSKSLDLPTYYFYTGGASGLCSFLHLPTIDNITSGSIKDQDILFDVPGVPTIHSSHFLAGFVDKNRPAYKDFINTARTMAKSTGIIANTFVGFEERAVGTLRDGKCIPDGQTPPTYFIGPLIADDNEVDPSENACLKWLNLQPIKSVVFLSFGSVGVFKKRQLKEIAIGLERSKQRFLWVVRDPPPDEENESNSGGGKELDLDDILPEGFLARTADKGLVIKNWAPQPVILGHESVGGFVSHCGWNSVLEAVAAGVPMVAWPLYAEQNMNRVYLVEEMKVALAVDMSSDGFVTATAVEEKVKELMEGDQEGRAVREQILEMSEQAKAATEDDGSSRVEFFKLTNSWTTL